MRSGSAAFATTPPSLNCSSTPSRQTHSPEKSGKVTSQGKAWVRSWITLDQSWFRSWVRSCVRYVSGQTAFHFYTAELSSWKFEFPFDFRSNFPSQGSTSFVQKCFDDHPLHRQRKQFDQRRRRHGSLQTEWGQTLQSWEPHQCIHEPLHVQPTSGEPTDKSLKSTGERERME
jgi:hypothetical protein